MDLFIEHSITSTSSSANICHMYIIYEYNLIIIKNVTKLKKKNKINTESLLYFKAVSSLPAVRSEKLLQDPLWENQNTPLHCKSSGKGDTSYSFFGI